MRFRAEKLAACAAALLLFIIPPVVQAIDIDFDTPPTQFNLIPGLIEVSGLALAPDGALFAHNDEHAIVYKLDITTGAVTAAFALGTPTIDADFEGIAIARDRIYLITSNGIIYESIIGAHKSRVKFNAYDTGVGDFCEVEGLTLGQTDTDFLIACKQAISEALKQRLLIYRWDLNARLPVESPVIDIAFDRFLAEDERKKFRPSALEYVRDTGEFIVVSAKGKSLYNFDREGAVVTKTKLKKSLHKQPEGLALMPSGALVVSDEGKKNTPPKISIYRPKP